MDSICLQQKMKDEHVSSQSYVSLYRIMVLLKYVRVEIQYCFILVHTNGKSINTICRIGRRKSPRPAGIFPSADTIVVRGALNWII
jgi:hypothetical protein